MSFAFLPTFPAPAPRVRITGVCLLCLQSQSPSQDKATKKVARHSQSDSECPPTVMTVNSYQLSSLALNLIWNFEDAETKVSFLFAKDKSESLMLSEKNNAMCFTNYLRECQIKCWGIQDRRSEHCHRLQLKVSSWEAVSEGTACAGSHRREGKDTLNYFLNVSILCLIWKLFNCFSASASAVIYN